MMNHIVRCFNIINIQTPHSQNIADLISLIANIVTIIGIVGLLLAYRDYKNRQNEEKKKKLTETIRAVRSVKHQLDVIGKWTGFSGGGYKQKDQASWIKSQANIVGNPFHSVFNIEYSSIINLGVLPAMEYFSNDINEAIAFVEQWVTSFNSNLEGIKRFSYSRTADSNIILHLKLNKAIKVGLTTEEKRFVSKLVEMYTILHFQIIGDETTKTLHFWHKRLKSLLDKLEKETEKTINNLNG